VHSKRPPLEQSGYEGDLWFPFNIIDFILLILCAESLRQLPGKICFKMDVNSCYTMPVVVIHRRKINMSATKKFLTAKKFSF